MRNRLKKCVPLLCGLPLTSLGWVPAIILSTGTTAATIRIEYQFICIDFLYAGPFVPI